MYLNGIPCTPFGMEVRFYIILKFYLANYYYKKTTTSICMCRIYLLTCIWSIPRVQNSKGDPFLILHHGVKIYTVVYDYDFTYFLTP